MQKDPETTGLKGGGEGIPPGSKRANSTELEVGFRESMELKKPQQSWAASWKPERRWVPLGLYFNPRTLERWAPWGQPLPAD